MKVSVQCPDCGKSYRIGDESLGARAHCKSCGRTFTISMDETISLGAKKPVIAEQVEPATRKARQLPKKIGQYVLQRKLGAGAMGEVYLAHDPDLDREVAIKVLPETFSSDQERLQRFLREARLAARVHHTNAVTVYQVGAAGGLAYIAMEYVAGMPLDDTVAKQRPLAWRQATQVFRDAAAGLSAAHKLGVFHRDVKPGNLMLSSDGTTKVVDFGLARAQEMDSSLTQQGTLLGTPAYMAPEQWMGNHVDARSDLYALACTYFYLLTGRPPFDAPSLLALGYQHRHEPLPDPRDLAVSIPDEACRILLRAAAKDPAERFQSADELISELDVMLGCPDEMLSFGALWSDFGGLFAAGPESMNASAGGDHLGPYLPAADLFQSTSAYALPTLQPAKKASRPSLPAWVWIASGGVAALLLLLAAVIIFSPKYGQVQITLSDDAENVEIRLDGDTISIDGLDEPLKLKVGEHDLVASSPNFETVTRSFSVKRNEVTVIDVTFVPKATPAEPAVESIAVTPQPTAPEPSVMEPTVPEATPESAEPTGPSTSPTTDPLDSTTVASIPSNLTNSIGMRLQLISAGEFMMGSPASDTYANSDERPQHKVQITKPFYLQTTEVTQRHWEAVMETTPWKGQSDVREGPNHPATYVSWDDATEFCRRLSARDGREYRLPTEAEWEYSCRAGTMTKYSFADDRSALQQYGWFSINSKDIGESYAHPVGAKRPNAWGLYDMHGNVADWCADWYDASYYGNSAESAPQGPRAGSARVVRGGSWFNGARDCRCAFRWKGPPDASDAGYGFRVAMAVPASAEGTTPPPAASATTLANSIDMKLRLIPAGEFMMGAPATEEHYSADEGPLHMVRITEPFYLGTYEVTQGQWEQVMGTTPWSGKQQVRNGDAYPALDVTWEDAVEFCRRLSLLREEQRAGRVYRLPTEAQWEYACRAGTRTAYSFGDSASQMDTFGWTDENTSGAGEPYAHRVGQKRSNAWGLYDMHGNAWEWCADWHGDDYYANSPFTDPTGPRTGKLHLFRGGSWNSSDWGCRSAERPGPSLPKSPFPKLGLRVAMTLAEITTSERPKIDGVSATDMPNLPAGCVVAYSFDRDTLFKQGSKLYVRDLSGNDYHGLLNNVTVTEGTVGTAAEFAGKPDCFVKLPDENGQYPANDFTIMASIKGEGLTILNLNHSPCESAVSARWGGALFYYWPPGRSADLSFVVRGHAGRDNNIQSSDNSIPRNVWTHAAVTRKSRTVTFYINGKRDRVHTMPTGPIIYDYQTYDTNEVTIGVRRIGDPGNFGHGAESAARSAFTGLIDEFFLFDRALSAKEIADFYDRQ